VLELKPGLYEAELNLGILLIEQKQFSEAADLLRAAAERKPDQARPKLYLGEALLASGHYPQAAAQFQAALKLDAASAHAQLGLGRALAAEGKLAEAEPHFLRAAELDGSLSSFLLELAARYEEARQLEKALAFYQRFQDDPAVRERTGMLFLELERYDEAAAALESAVKASPTAANQYALATVYLRSGRPDKAKELLQQAVNSQPSDLDLRMAFGRVLRDQRDFASAIGQFRHVAQARPGFVEAWRELAGLLMVTENYPQALAALDRLEALGDQNPALHYFRAIAFDRTRQPKPALENYEKFLAQSEGKNPDEEFKARQRIRVLQKELNRR
jgi:tetratricopeptide (TPR) repeat protein